MAFEGTVEVCSDGCQESAGPSRRHCCPTAQLLGAEPSITQECGAHGSKEQVSHSAVSHFGHGL